MTQHPEPAALLRELVRIPSPSREEAQAAQFCADLLAAGGLDVERIGDPRDTVLARMTRGSGPTLLLNTHLDTVPVGKGWTVEPLDVEWDGERLFGRGSNDAKASVAAMISTVLGLAQDPDWRGTVLLGLTACEEVSNAGMGALLEHLGSEVQIDAAVTGEPTGLEVCRAQSGLAILRAEWNGHACHAAHVTRREHENALLLAAAELSTLAPYVVLEGAHPLLGASTVVPTVLHAGERHNVIPDHAEALFDGRLAPPHDAAEAVSALAQHLPSARISIKSERLRPVETAAEHALVQLALECAGKSEAIGSATMSDMALLSGLPAIKCGPGVTARSHTPDEFVLRSELEAGCAFYADLVPAVLAALQNPAVTP